jgi:hypothetical protein
MINIRIEGKRYVPGFNGVGQIDLNEFRRKNVLPPEIKGGTFSHVGVLNLETVQENDRRWLNIGIRAEGNTEERIESYINSFQVNGFRTDNPPPLVSLDGYPRDGRGRILAAKRMGEKYIPVYYYNIIDNSIKNQITDGIKQNLRHDIAFGVSTNSIVDGVISLINANALTPTKVKIRHYLNNELNNSISKYNAEKIIDSVLRRVERNSNPQLVFHQSKVMWKDFCSDAGAEIDDISRILMCADDSMYPLRSFCRHVLTMNYTQPVEFVLFSNRNNPAEVAMNIKDFKKTLEDLWKATLHLTGQEIQKQNRTTLNLQVTSYPFICERAVPQLVPKHDAARDRNRLVNIATY